MSCFEGAECCTGALHVVRSPNLLFPSILWKTCDVKQLKLTNVNITQLRYCHPMTELKQVKDLLNICHNDTQMSTDVHAESTNTSADVNV